MKEIAAKVLCNTVASGHSLKASGQFPCSDYTLPAGQSGREMWFLKTVEAWQSKVFELQDSDPILNSTEKIERKTKADKLKYSKRNDAIRKRHFEINQKAARYAETVGQNVRAVITNHHRDGMAIGNTLLHA